MTGLSQVFAIEYGSVYPMSVVEAVYRKYEFFESESDAYEELRIREERLDTVR